MYIQTNYTDINEVIRTVRFDYRGNANSLNSRFTDEELLNLAGGIPEDDFAYFNFSIEIVSPNVFELRADSSSYELKRTVDLHDMEISNDSLVVNEDFRSKGLGTKILLNQIKEAKNKGFRMLTVYALGGIEHSENSEFNGYSHWGKYGYEMFPYYQEKFEDWIKQRALHPSTLSELVLDATLYNIWKQEGFSWSGFFDLKSETSIYYLRIYIESQIAKGFNYELWPEVFG